MAPTPEHPKQLPPSGRIIRSVSESSVSIVSSGPLPPPEMLQAYEEICPGSATRIIEMAEAQSAHRRQMEDKLSSAAVQEMRLKFGEARFGQVCALLLAVAFVTAGIVAIMHGHEIAGAVVAVTGGGIGIPAIISAFMRGKVEARVEASTTESLADRGQNKSPQGQSKQKPRK
jgi:uncharacterized membrane protein